ncbi:hypothetical protein K438DRAFT_1765053 [Mycena galopus ATCC 62051]|nr:hypothetical protein K438DRAFT_1765053 [Mycena galopus ATCC 62051]
MKFTSYFAVLSLGLFAAASPTRPDSAAMAARSTVPNVAVVPLTLSAVFNTLKKRACSRSGSGGPTLNRQRYTPRSGAHGALNTASAQLAANPPGDMTVTDEVLAQLIKNVLDDLNTALNTLVPKLGLDGLLTPLDAAVAGLLTSLNASLVPGLLTALQPLLVGLGGVVGRLLAGLNLSGL